ncbi:MAG: right-handed parallel beta-helix repeat-containing protein [Mucinivorans sp.]
MRHLTTILSILLLSMATATATAQNRLHLSPRGNDLATGSAAEPLATLSAACLQARNIPGHDTIYVNIEPGDYFMKQPLILTASDTHPIIFRGTPGARATFYGGTKIEGWWRDSLGRFRTTIPEVLGGNFNFEQLWINGTRATRARTPNTEWMAVLSSKENVYQPGDNRLAAFATQQIDVDPSTIESLRGLTNEQMERVMVMFYHKWDVTRKGLAFAVPDSGRIFTVGCGMKPWNRIGGGSRFILENYLGALDAPGEWFLDRANGELYYIPRKGETIENIQCIAPTLRQLIVINGRENAPVCDKIFTDINFAVSSYIMPTYGNEPMQAAATIEAAIMADYAQGVIFRNCNIQHTGAYAIWLRRGCVDNKIERCYIADLGAGGIKIGDVMMPAWPTALSQRNIVDNNIITHAGYVFPCGVGVAMLHAANNRVTHNEIADIRYSGVSVGWFWGYNATDKKSVVVLDDGSTDFRPLVSPSVGNVVEYNHIHHIGWGELSDMGAVYTLGQSPGTRVSNNVIHDVYSYDYGGWGLYTDEGSTDIVMENNLVYGCKSGGFHQHYGKNNKIRNNIFAFGHYQQLQFTRIEPHRSLDFTHNIVLGDCGVMLSGPWAEADIFMDSNIYWDMRPDTVKFRGMTFDKWQQNDDKSSILADPMFRDPLHGDFTFKNNKAIRKTGFKPFDYRLCGVYGSAEWIEKAKMDSTIHQDFVNVILKREKEHSRIYDK